MLRIVLVLIVIMLTSFDWLDRDRSSDISAQHSHEKELPLRLHTPLLRLAEHSY
jgi:hypothetical protein